MVKFRAALGLAAWALILAPTVASSAALEKYLILPPPPSAPNKSAPSKTVIQPGAVRLFNSFEAQVKTLAPMERTKLRNGIREKHKAALERNDYAKAKYYGQLLNIILRYPGSNAQ